MRFHRLLLPLSFSLFAVFFVFSFVDAQTDNGHWYAQEDRAVIWESTVTSNEAGLNAFVYASRVDLKYIDWTIKHISQVTHTNRFVELSIDLWEYWCENEGCKYPHTLYFSYNGSQSFIINQGETILLHDGSQADRCVLFTHCKNYSNSAIDLSMASFSHKVTGSSPNRTRANLSVSFVLSDDEEDEDDDTVWPPTHPGGGAGTFCTFTDTLTIDDPSTLTDTIGITNTGGLSITGNLTGTDPITVDVPYTRTINLIQNPGFESGGSTPTDWDKYKSGTLLSGYWDNLVAGVGWGGSRAAQGNGGEFDFLQDVSLSGSGTYALGFHARCTDESPNCSESVSIYWGQMILAGSTTPPIATGSPISTTYTEISGTKSTGGGVANISIKTSGTGVYVDDVFLFAVDDSGAPLCDKSLYEPGPGAGDTGYNPPPVIIPNPGGDPLPIPGGGLAIKCYECSLPSNMLSIGSWIGWLVCHLRNLFTCQLRVWILDMVNALMGVLRLIWAFVTWLPGLAQNGVFWWFNTIADVMHWIWNQATGAVVWGATQIANALGWVWAQAQNGAIWAVSLFQAGVNWFLSMVNGGLGWLSGLVTGWWDFITEFIGELWAALAALPGLFLNNILNSDFIQGIWSRLHWLQAIWDAAKLLIAAFMEIIKDLYGVLIKLVEMLIGVFQKLRDAFTSNPYEITIITNEGEISTIEPGALYANGPNGTKILWMFLAGVSAIDWFVGEFGLEMVLMMVVGTLSIGIIFWTLRLWHDILPI